MFLLNLVLNSSAALQVKEQAKQASLALLSEINSSSSTFRPGENVHGEPWLSNLNSHFSLLAERSQNLACISLNLLGIVQEEQLNNLFLPKWISEVTLGTLSSIHTKSTFNLIFSDLAELLKQSVTSTYNFTTNSALFANISFLLLFLAMTIYWINLAFFDKSLPKSQASLSFSSRAAEVPELANTSKLAVSGNVSLLEENNVADVNSGELSLKQIINPLPLPKGSDKDFSKKTFITSGPQSIGKYIILASNISLVFLLTSRWIESNHFPLSNLYESLMFLSWSCTTIYLILIYTSVKGNLFIEKLIGAILTPCALFLNAFATFSLPQEMQQAGPLVPALQSNWLMMHVTVMIISYAALILGSLLSIAFLIYNIAKSGFNGIDLKNQKLNAEQSSVSYGLGLQSDFASAPRNGTEANHPLVNSGVGSKNKIALNLDYLSYRIIGIGFPFLTIGILSGAVWANEAWGSYWSCDPKETWALLTWLVFAIYLHTRFTKGWEGNRPAVIAAVGFIVVWICYLGVNLLGEGLHSYGFFSGN